MAIRKIRTDEDPILRKKSKVVTNYNDRLKLLIDDMYETMDLAPGGEKPMRFYMINPEIIEKDGEEVSMEGCLSVPGKQGTVKRAKHIKVKYNDLEGKENIMEAEDFLARIIQHETDHLDGILYTDKAIDMYEAESEE